MKFPSLSRFRSSPSRGARVVVRCFRANSWLRPCRAAALALFATTAWAQTTVTLTNGQTNSTAYDTSSGAYTFTIASGTATQSGTVSGTGGIIKTGAGTLQLTGTADNSALTATVNAGTLVLAKTSSGSVHAIGGDATSVTVNNGGTVQFGGTGGDQIYSWASVAVNTGGTLDLNGRNEGFNTLTGAGTVTNTAAATTSTLTLGENNGSATFDGVLQNGAGTLALTKTGTGTLTLTAANTYTGATAINQGTLTLSGSGRLADTTALTVASGATFNLNGITDTIGSLAGAGNVTLGAGTLTAGGDNTSTTFSGVVSGTGSLTKSGSGTLTLSGANTYTGTTTVSAGTLTFTQPVRSEAWSIASGAALEMNFTSAGSYDLAPVSVTISGAGTLRQTGAGTLYFFGPATFNLSSGALIDVQGGNFTGGSNGNEVWTNNLSDLNVASGASFSGVEANVRVDALTGSGTIRSGWVGAGYTNFTFGVDNGSGTFAGVLADTDGTRPGSYVKTGSGTQILTGANTYTGTMTISGGTLQIGNGGTTGSLPGGVTNNATLAFNRSDATTFAGAISGSGSVAQLGSGTLTLSGANTYTGGTTLSAGTLALGSTGALGSSGTISFGGGALQFSSSNTTDYSSRFSTAASQSYQIDTNGQNVTLATALTSSGGSLTKSGTGTLTLTGANTYSGTTTISAGTLQIGAGGTTGSVAGNITNNAALTFNRSDAITFGGVISGTGALTQAGSGTLTLSAANTFTGGTTVSAGTLQIGNGGTTGSLAGNITNNAALAFNRSDASTFAGTISGTGALTQSGTGTLTLTAANTYTGATAINAGTLALSGSGRLADTTALTVASGATFNLNGITDTIGSLAGAGNVTLGAGTLTAGGDNTSTAFSGVMSGTGSLTKSGSGTLTLSGANTFTGGATISAGTLALGSAGALGSSGTISFGGGALQFSSSNTTDYSSRFSSAASQAYNIDTNGQNVTLASALTSSGGSLTKSGTGTLTLTAANTYAGATTINAGTLALSGSGRLADTAALTVASGATFNLNGITDTIGSLAGAGNVTLGAGALTAGGDNTSTAFSGVISGTGSLTKSGTGTLTLSGANTFTGGTTLSAGTLALGSTGALGSSGTISFNGGALQFSSSNTTDYSSRFSTAASQSYRLDTNGQNVTLASALTSSGGSLTKSGTGTLTLTAANTYTGATAVNAGTLALSGSGRLADTTALTVASGATFNLNGITDTIGSLAGAGNVTLGAGALTTGGDNTSTAFSGVMSGTGSLTKSGSGTLTLSGDNTFTGGTTISAGTLQIGAGSTTGSLAGNLTNNASLAFNRSDASTFAGTISGTGTLTQAGTGTLTLSGANTYSGGTILSAGTLALGSSGALGSSDTISFGGGTLQSSASNTTDYSSRFSSAASQTYRLDTNGQNVTLASALTSSGGSLTKLGTSTLTLTGNNTFTGATTISSGTLQIGAGGTTGSLAGDIANNSALTFNRSDTTTYSGVISGTGSLTKTGWGTLTLSGANTYTGSTILEAGTLVLGSSDALGNSGTISFNGGTLQYSSANTGDYSGRFDRSAGQNYRIDTGGQTVPLSSAFLNSDATLTKFGEGTLAAGLLMLREITVAGGTLTSNGISAEYLKTSATGSLNVRGAVDINGAGFDSSGSVTFDRSTGTIQELTIGSASGTSLLFWDSTNRTNPSTNQLDVALTVTVTSDNNQIAVNHVTVTALSIDFSGASNTLRVENGGQLLANVQNSGTGRENQVIVTGAGSLLTSEGLLLGSAISGNQGSTLTIQSGGAVTAYDFVRLGASSVSGNNTFYVSGGGGTLNIGAYDLLHPTTAGTLSGGSVEFGLGSGVVNFNQTDTTTFNSPIFGQGSLVQRGTGTTVLTGGNAYTGGTTVSAGTLALSGSGTLGADTNSLTLTGGTVDLGGLSRSAGAVTLAGGTLTNGTLTGASYDAQSGTVSAILAGSAALAKSTAGTLTLSSANTYTGGTTVSAGTLALSGSGTLGADANSLTLTGGTLDLGGLSRSAGAVTFAGGTLTNGTLTAASYDAQSGAVDAILAGSAALAKSTAGTLTLSGTNTFTGGTALAAGTLALDSTGALGSSGTISFGGGALQFSSSNTTDYSSRFSSAANQAYRLDTNGQNVTLASALTSSGGSLTQSGSGTLTLTAANTYTGATAINAGTLALSGSGRLADTTALTVASGATFNLNGLTDTIGSLAGTGNVTLGAGALTTGGDNTSTAFSGVMSGTGSLTKSGTGTLTLSGANTFTGGTTISAGTLTLSGSGTLGADTNALTLTGGTLDLGGLSRSAGAVTFAGGTLSNGTLTGASYDAQSGTVSANLAGGAGFVKSTAGTLTLSGANTYTGYTEINEGTLVLGSAAALGSTARVFVRSGATLDSGSYDFDLDRIYGYEAGGTLTGSGAFSSTASDGWNSSVYTNLAGSASLVKSGAGMLTLYGDNTFSGGTTINAGGVTFPKIAALGTGGFTVAPGAMAAFNVGGAGEFTSLDDIQSRGTFAVGSQLGLVAGSAPDYTLTDSTSRNVPYGLNLLDGTLVLTGTNTFAGGISLSSPGSKLRLGSAGAIGDTGTLRFNGGTLQWSAANTTDYSARFATDGYQDYRFDTGGQNITLATALSAGGNISKLGAGTLTLSAPANLGGSLWVQEGTLDLGGHAVATSQLTLGTVSDAGSWVDGTLTHGTVALTGGYYSGFVIRGTLGVTLTGSSNDLRLLIGGADQQVFLNGTNDLVNTADHSPTLIGSWEQSGSYNTRVILGNANALSAATENVIVDAGTVDLNGVANVRANSIQMTGGYGIARLVNDNTASTASFAGGVNLGANWRSHLGGDGHLVLSGEVSGEHLVKIGTGTLTLTGANTYGGDTHIVAGTLQIGDGGTSGTLAPVNVINHGTLAFNRSDAVSFSNVISGSGSLVQSGAGTLTLSAANTFTGGTTIAAGTLALTGNGTLGADTNSLALTGGSLDLGGLSRTAGTVTLAGGTLSNGTLTGASYDARSGTVSAVLAGSAALTKSTAGTVTLSAANTYSGGTTISAGTLVAGNTAAFGTGTVRLDAGTLDLGGYAIGNALDLRGGTLTGLAAYTGTQTVRTAASYSGNVGGALVLASGGSLNTTGATFTGNLTIQNGATLGGTGTVAFATIDAGGILAPGNSPGTITYTHGLTLNDGAILNFELGTTSDLIRVSSGTLTGSASAGGITLNLANSGGFTAASYTLFNFSGATTSSFTASDFTFGTTIAGYTYSLALVGDTLQLTAFSTATAVPEPSTYAAALAAVALLATALRRRPRFSAPSRN